MKYQEYKSKYNQCPFCYRQLTSTILAAGENWSSYSEFQIANHANGKAYYIRHNCYSNIDRHSYENISMFFRDITSDVQNYKETLIMENQYVIDLFENDTIITTYNGSKKETKCPKMTFNDAEKLLLLMN